MVEMFNPLVTIVIPVYNGSNYVKEAIDSALNQTYKNLEIVVVNDGSTDTTDEILKSYGDKIRYFSKENGGVSTALNLAIKEAKGEYISWLSHDDLYLPNKIQRQIEELSKLDDKNTIMFSNFKVLYQENKKEINVNMNFDNQNNKNDIVRLLFCSELHGCSLLIPKSCFYSIAFFDETLRTTQDYDLWFKFVKNGISFFCVKEALIKSRSHMQQDSLQKIDICNKEKQNLFKKILKEQRNTLVCLDKNNFKQICNAMKGLYSKKELRLLSITRLLRGKIF